MWSNVFHPLSFLFKYLISQFRQFESDACTYNTSEMYIQMYTKAYEWPQASSQAPSVISVIFTPQFASCALPSVLSLQLVTMQCTPRGLSPLRPRNMSPGVCQPLLSLSFPHNGTHLI